MPLRGVGAFGRSFEPGQERGGRSRGHSVSCETQGSSVRTLPHADDGTWGRRACFSTGLPHLLFPASKRTPPPPLTPDPGLTVSTSQTLGGLKTQLIKSPASRPSRAPERRSSALGLMLTAHQNALEESTAPTTVNSNNIFCNKCEEFTVVAIPPPLTQWKCQLLGSCFL